MWLLKLHIAISILCALTHFGFGKVFKDVVKQNGYTTGKGIKGYLAYWIFFIPLMNVAVVIVSLIRITMTKEELDKWCEEHKKKGREENDQN